MISAVILTHNNQEMIGDVLETLKWCDERIIVDDNSTDKTRDIAKDAGAIVYQHALNDNFADQRNFGLEKAKGPARNAPARNASHTEAGGSHSDAGGDWVLFVDSDELVTSKLRDEILKQVQDDKYVGFYISRKDFLFGRELKYGETANVKLLRLAKKNTGEWERAVHEAWNVKGPVAYLTTPLLHYPHSTISEFLTQINRYTTINARVFYNEGKRISVWQIITYPKAKFIQNYIIRLGFLDGTAGFVVAMMMSFHSFLTRGKLWELQQKNT